MSFSVTGPFGPHNQHMGALYRCARHAVTKLRIVVKPSLIGPHSGCSYAENSLSGASNARQGRRPRGRPRTQREGQCSAPETIPPQGHRVQERRRKRRETTQEARGHSGHERARHQLGSRAGQEAADHVHDEDTALRGCRVTPRRQGALHAPVQPEAGARAHTTRQGHTQESPSRHARPSASLTDAAETVEAADGPHSHSPTRTPAHAEAAPSARRPRD